METKVTGAQGSRDLNKSEEWEEGATKRVEVLLGQRIWDLVDRYILID